MSNATAREQLMLELVNRARLDPLGEAQRFAIDLNQGLAGGTLTVTAKQPLAMNDLLIASARQHSTWMLNTDIFDHTGLNGSSPGDRMEDAGYTFSGSWTWGENIAWSGTTGAIDLSAAIVQHHEGLFRSAGHRVNILGDAFQEIGIGQSSGQFLSNGTNWNASMLTQNFAKSGTAIFVTGVAYNDTDADRFYDIGEGVANVAVSASGMSDTTGTGGGYELGLANGTHTVALGAMTVQVTLAGRNIKLDAVNSTTLQSSSSVTLVAGVSTARLIGTEAAGLQGSTAAEQLGGNDAANVVNGGGGSDSIWGGWGVDTLNGGDGDDWIAGGGDGDAIGGDAGHDTVNGEGGNDWIWGGWGWDTLNGNEGNDWLFGDGNSDSLGGGAGNDTLVGGRSADWMWGGTESDTFVVRAADLEAGVVDTIMDMQELGAAGQDRVQFEGLRYNQVNWYNQGNSAVIQIVLDTGGSAYVEIRNFSLAQLHDQYVFI